MHLSNLTNSVIKWFIFNIEKKCLFPGVFWLWHLLYSVGPHPVSSLHIHIFVVSRAFMAGAASQAGDADSSRFAGVRECPPWCSIVGATVTVHQFVCISHVYAWYPEVTVASLTYRLPLWDTTDCTRRILLAQLLVVSLYPTLCCENISLFSKWNKMIISDVQLQLQLYLYKKTSLSCFMSRIHLWTPEIVIQKIDCSIQGSF